MQRGHAWNSEDRVRRRVYGLLLLFILIAGVPMLTVPRLRRRLADRVEALRAAMAGEVAPATARVGENREPFPEQYLRPEPAPGAAAPDAAAAGQRAQLPAILRPEARKPYRVPETLRPGRPLPPQAGETRPPELIRETPEAPESPASSDAATVQFKQGKIEAEAYQRVLQSSKTLAAMVQDGQNRSNGERFSRWDAAHRGEDLYWVRVVFRNQANENVEYIWQVRLVSGEVSPLSFNARSLEP